jgi:hypothetical protein
MSGERGAFLPSYDVAYVVAREEDRTIGLEHALVSGVHGRFIHVNPRSQVVRDAAPTDIDWLGQFFGVPRMQRFDRAP